jgi:acetyl-CoA carboxylase / biotin carboxylase 1
MDPFFPPPPQIVFTGPPAAPMHALGDKIGSTIIAQSAGVPTIAWNGMDLRVDYNKEGCIAPEIYEAANIKTAKQAVESANRVGYPVMIKASAGGGGKGIRQVTREEDVAAAFRQVQGEVPGSPIFIMKLADHSRHLEVQLLADKFGNVCDFSSSLPSHFH